MGSTWKAIWMEGNTQDNMCLKEEQQATSQEVLQCVSLMFLLNKIHSSQKLRKTIKLSSREGSKDWWRGESKESGGGGGGKSILGITWREMRHQMKRDNRVSLCAPHVAGGDYLCLVCNSNACHIMDQGIATSD